ncbi:MAG: hypothetical protein R6U57_02730 [Anaerolineales bacterium]
MSGNKDFIASLLLILIIAVSAFIVVPEVGSFTKGVMMNIDHLGIWRSARFARSGNFADYISFLREQIPEDGHVVLPPERVSNWALSDTPFMQFFLSPREVGNCTTVECGSHFIDQKGTYILIMGLGRFPEGDLRESNSKVRMFNDTWGVYGPESGLGKGTYSKKNSVLQSLFINIIFPISVFFYLLVMGLMCTSRMIPRYSPWFQIGIGYGLVNGVLSLLTYLSLLILPGLDLRVLFFLYLASLGLFFLYQLTAGNINFVEIIQNLYRSLNIWLLFLLGWSAILFFVAVGSGYHATDAIVLWGVKGEGIANKGLTAVNEWGTNTTNYPLNIPLLIAVFNKTFGTYLPASKLIFPGFFLSLMLLLIGYLEDLREKNSMALGILAFAMMPVMVRHARIGYSNLPLTFYIVASILLFCGVSLEKEVNKSYKDWPLIILFVILAVWTRPEGVWTIVVIWGFLAIYNLIILRQSKIRKMTAYLLFPAVSFWLLWKVTSVPFAVEDSVETVIRDVLFMFSRGNFCLSNLVNIFKYFSHQFFNMKTWGGVGIGLTVGIIYRLLGRQITDWRIIIIFLSGMASLLIVIGMYYTLAFDSTYDIGWWLKSGFNRMIMPSMCLLWVSVLLFLFSDIDHNMKA